MQKLGRISDEYYFYAQKIQEPVYNFMPNFRSYNRRRISEICLNHLIWKGNLKRGPFKGVRQLQSKYSCPHIVRPKSEELISRPFVGEIQFRLVLQKRMGTESAIGCMFFIHQVLLFCPTQAHSIREDMGVARRICSDAGRLDLFAEKSTCSVK